MPKARSIASGDVSWFHHRATAGSASHRASRAKSARRSGRKAIGGSVGAGWRIADHRGRSRDRSGAHRTRPAGTPRPMIRKLLKLLALKRLFDAFRGSRRAHRY
jgi:hypothetical protein